MEPIFGYYVFLNFYGIKSFFDFLRQHSLYQISWFNINTLKEHFNSRNGRVIMKDELTHMFLGSVGSKSHLSHIVK